MNSEHRERIKVCLCPSSCVAQRELSCGVKDAVPCAYLGCSVWAGPGPVHGLNARGQ